MTTTNDFLPPDYEPPKSHSNYMKFQDGDNKFRILSKPILGWLDWKDKTPYRFQLSEKPTNSMSPDQKIKHFWAFVVWNYDEEDVQVLEITQATIQNAIRALSQNSDWGDPFDYDIKVSKKGSKLDTEYVVTPVPHKPVAKFITDAYNNKPCDLESLFDGEDPFDLSKKDLFR